MMLDDRSKMLMKALVERYIADGQPVGSRTLSRAAGMELSPATIRNVMSDLEDLGLIVSPHTSAGRIPTARGYRLFVDTMLTVQRGQFAAHSLAPDQPQKVISNAANLLSSLSQFVGIRYHGQYRLVVAPAQHLHLLPGDQPAKQFEKLRMFYGEPIKQATAVMQRHADRGMPQQRLQHGQISALVGIFKNPGKIAQGLVVVYGQAEINALH